MRTTLPRLITALSTATVILSCSGDGVTEIADKIENGKPLDSNDYDQMLDYLETATEASVPRLKEALTTGDVERIESEMSEEYPYAGPFGTALLHDYPELSASQIDRMSSIRQKAREACQQ
ncbi:MAG: hypothetical protein K2G01_04450 [Paramuribaculum sp.]|nr:hypothetical protein [Paramuribaculum sp.]MDE6324438.1 hypothetical protein [Paramuribaculum sp.]